VESYEHASDTALAVGIARFREQALHEAYRRHAGVVCGIARRVTRDRALAEEITQEVFLALWREPERFDPDRGSLRTFLATLAHRRAVDAVRSEVARRRREEHRESQLGPPSDAEIEAIADRTSVEEALAQLSPQERTAIELAYFEGLTYRDVARRLETPEGTVKTRIRSALAKLGSALEPSKVVER